MALLSGAALVGLNAYGLTIPDRAPALRNIHPPPMASGTVPTWREIQASLLDLPEDIAERARALTWIVNRAIVHDWEDARQDSFQIRVPIAKNWVLWLAGQLFPKRFGKYEYHDSGRALRRGVGLCSQQAIILEQLAERSGIPARIVSLDGHVVVEALVERSPDRWWTLDTDLGVVFQRSTRELADDLDRVTLRYAERGFPESAQEWARGVYAKGPMRTSASALHYGGLSRAPLDVAATPLSWLIPFGLMAVAVLGLRRSRSA